ncbi:MAG: hypothetical protein Tsb005_12220 [Gammaproteobacteria bacterium]
MYRSAISDIPFKQVSTIPKEKFELWYKYLTNRGVNFEIGTVRANQILSASKANGLFEAKLIDLETNTFKRTIYLPENPKPSVFYEEGLHALDSLKGRSKFMMLDGKEINAYEYRAKQILLNASPKRFEYEEFRILEDHLELVLNNRY